MRQESSVTWTGHQRDHDSNRCRSKGSSNSTAWTLKRMQIFERSPNVFRKQLPGLRQDLPRVRKNTTTRNALFNWSLALTVWKSIPPWAVVRCQVQKVYTVFWCGTEEGPPPWMCCSWADALVKKTASRRRSYLSRSCH